MKQKSQIIFIRGGEAFEKKADFYKYLLKREYNPYHNPRYWRDWIEWALSEEYEMFSPLMPAKQNADYIAWKIWFEKIFSYLNKKNPILIGSSLGATFLLKYLSENKFPRKIQQLHLVAPAVLTKSLTIEGLGNFKFKIAQVSKIQKMCQDINLYHSKDDTIVPYVNTESIIKYLPQAKLHTFNDRGHFLQPAFPELLKNIKQP